MVCSFYGKVVLLQGEYCTYNPLMHDGMGAEPLVKSPVRSLGQQVQIDIAENGHVAVRVLSLPLGIRAPKSKSVRGIDLDLDRAGKKPAKKNSSVGNPAAISAEIKALGPGTGTTATSLSIAARTSRKPGSLIDGVPASDTTAMSLPCLSRSMSSAVRCCSLCS